MIWESEPWRKELVATAARLERRKSQTRWPSASLARLEQDVMLGAYSVRKLVEAQTKVPHTVRDRRVAVEVIPARGDPDGIGPDLMNWHQLDRWFNFGTSTPGTLTVVGLCNQVIHSWLFVPVMDDGGGLRSILLSSDRSRRTALYQVDIDDLADVFRCVGESPVAKLGMARGEDGKWIVHEALDECEASAATVPLPEAPEAARVRVDLSERSGE